jgi:hypothetical protein
MQIVAAAMAGGVLIFLAVVVILVWQKDGGRPDGRLLTYIAVAFAIVAVFAWSIVPSVIAGQLRQPIVDGSATRRGSKSDHGAESGNIRPLTAIYQTRLIIGSALLEGAAFFCLVAYLLERQPLSLVVAVLFCLLLVSQIPSVARVESWVAGEVAIIEQLRVTPRT